MKVRFTAQASLSAISEPKEERSLLTSVAVREKQWKLYPGVVEVKESDGNRGETRAIRRSLDGQSSGVV